MDEEGIYTAMEIARYVIDRCYREYRPISNLQLQKFLYFIQVEFLQAHNRPLFNDEIEAWPYGPVVREVYTRFSIKGASPLPYNYDTEIDIDAMKIINNVIEERIEIPVWDLVDETHEINGAWYKTYNNGTGKYRDIPLEFMR